jgi:hypothetical protein
VTGAQDKPDDLVGSMRRIGPTEEDNLAWSVTALMNVVACRGRTGTAEDSILMVMMGMLRESMSRLGTRRRAKMINLAMSYGVEIHASELGEPQS